jgi:hypothetical protein
MLLWHEMAHQYQFRRDGFGRFFARYAVDWHKGLLRGCSSREAYRAIGYELEADAMIDPVTGVMRPWASALGS